MPTLRLKKKAAPGRWRNVAAITARNWIEISKTLSETAEARSVPSEPVRRVFIPKAEGGRDRSEFSGWLEDKIVQRGAVGC